MDRQGICLKFGAAVILGAVVLRLLGGGVLDRAIRVLTAPETISMLVFLETGRVVRPTAPEPTEETVLETEAPTSPPETTQAEQEAATVFSPEDAALVEVNNVCGLEADVGGFLTQTLAWDLTESAPTVLIVHSHGTECYADGPETGAYRSRDTAHNVVSVGDRLVQVLEAGGVHAVHDRTMHDSPSYNASYVNSRESVEAYLAQYPTIQLVLDIHRDAVENADGTQRGYALDVNGQSTAQLMMVVGTDAGGRNHPNWKENLALAVKLHVQLEKQTPGICRPISFRAQRFNQDLSAGGMLIEVGAAGNTRQEALLGAEVLAEGIIALAHGTEGVLY